MYTRGRHAARDTLEEPSKIIIHFRVDVLLSEAGSTERLLDPLKHDGVKDEIRTGKRNEVRLLANMVNGDLKLGVWFGEYVCFNSGELDLGVTTHI